ncbi:MAG: hypothetical protein JNK87_16500 [Bryobacterales bacterium]|nr:hypothetical protein [Bryobacterales bacterium]
MTRVFSVLLLAGILGAQPYATGDAAAFTTLRTEVTYRDQLGASRVVPVVVRIPQVPGKLPAVVWSAGGASAEMGVWSEATARAGYLTVTVSHPPRTEAEGTALCRENRAPATIDCSRIDWLLLDRPNDLRQVLTAMERLNQSGPEELREKLDAGRIAVGGFAEGSSAAITLAGASRLFLGEDPRNAITNSDPRPVAFVALSPYGPEREGFFDREVGRDVTSFTTVRRPVFLATGAGDNNCVYGPQACLTGDGPARRRTVFELLPGESKFELFVKSTKSYHDFFGSPSGSECAAKGVEAALCGSFEAMLQGSVLAFLDAHVRQLAAAHNWLQGAAAVAEEQGMEFRSGPMPAIPLVEGPCPGFANCLYTPASFEFEVLAPQRVTYTDITGRARTIEFTVRVPRNRAGAMPVAIWAHGGGDGRNAPGGSVGALSVWSEVGARSGYISVSPAFRAREGDDRLALCRYLSLTDMECETFSTVGWDRPFDIKAILDLLANQNSSGPFQGRIDMNRIAVSGHSAGSSATISVAGGYRVFGRNRYGGIGFFEDPRPKAFVALSPSAPGSSANFETSFQDDSSTWTTVVRPMMTVTGAGDGHEQFPQGRRIPFDYMPAGDKYRIWVNDNDFGHEAYGDGLADCDTTTRAKCQAFQALVTGAVMSFLDAYVQELPRAMEYVKQGYVRQAGRGVVELSVK